MKDTKKNILDSSFILFLQKNFKEVTVDDILKKADISKGAFYHHFKSKKHLFKEIVNEYLLSTMARNFNQFDKSSLDNFYHDYLKDLKISLETHLKIQFNPKIKTNLAVFSNLMFEAVKTFPDFLKKALSIKSGELKEWTSVISLARKKKEIKSKMTDEQLAQIFSLIFDGVRMQLHIEGELKNLIRELEKFWDSFYDDIKA
jgi:TetR/AcrR family transcriptional regulator, transcriptional repressor for nem operon